MKDMTIDKLKKLPLLSINMLGKFGKVSAAVMMLLALMALAWMFAISKATLELPTLALTLLVTVVAPLLTVFMMVKKQRGFTFAMVFGVLYLLLGLATVFRVMGSTDSFGQTTMYIGVVGAVLGLLLVFASTKAKKEDTDEETVEEKPNPFEELKRQKAEEVAAAQS